jgi:hypothetical protein
MALSQAQRDAKRAREARAIAEFKKEEAANKVGDAKRAKVALAAQKKKDAARKKAAASAKKAKATTKKPTGTQAKKKTKASLLSQMRNRNKTIDKEVKRAGG